MRKERGTLARAMHVWFLSKNMIGLEYQGQVHYITRMEDFRDFMEPSVYEALAKALDGCLLQESYKEKYEDLLTDYEILESEYDDLDYLKDELADCEEKLDDIKEKYKTFKHAIEVLIGQYHQRYIEQEDIIPTLEKLISE